MARTEAPPTEMVDAYMRRPYRMEVYWDEDYWAAEFPELPGLTAGHETWEGLLVAVEEAKRAWFAGSLVHGYPIPEPALSRTFSGRIALRLPIALHAAAVQTAARNETSLNTFLVAAVARELGRQQS